MYHRTPLPEGSGMTGMQAPWLTRGDDDMASEYAQSSPPSYPNGPADYSEFVGGQPTMTQVSHAHQATTYSSPSQYPVVSHPSHGYFDIQQGYAFHYQAPYSDAQASYQNHHFQPSSMNIPAAPFSPYDQPVSRQLQGTYIGQDTHPFAHHATSPAAIASTTSHSHTYDQRVSLPPYTASRSPGISEGPPPNPTSAVPSTPNITTYPCMWSSHGRQCGARIEGEKNRIAQHLRDYHNFVCDEEQMTCLWDRCGTVLQRRNVARHIVTFHLGVKVLCKHCGIPISRQDANRKHEKSCASASKVGATVYHRS